MTGFRISYPPSNNNLNSEYQFYWHYVTQVIGRDQYNCQKIIMIRNFHYNWCGNVWSCFYCKHFIMGCIGKISPRHVERLILMSHHSNSIWILMRSTHKLQTSDFVELPCHPPQRFPWAPPGAQGPKTTPNRHRPPLKEGTASVGPPRRAQQS